MIYFSLGVGFAISLGILPRLILAAPQKIVKEPNNLFG